jgi:hypothetical protein
VSTFQELRGLVRARCGVDSTDQLASDPIVDGIVNEALQTLGDEAPDGWPWYLAEVTWSTVAGTNGYSYATLSPAVDLRAVTWVRIEYPTGERWPLERLHRTEQYDRYTATAQDVPQSWSSEGMSVTLWPTPNGVYTMRAQIVFVEPLLESDGDEPFLPARFHPALVALGASLLYQRMHNTTEAAAQMAAYQQWVKRMRAAAKPYRGPGRVREVPESVFS